ncbi:MAG: type II secretion system F family protein [Actinomycetota bacterium]
MRPQILAAALAALPGLFAAVAADIAERDRVRSRAGAGPAPEGWARPFARRGGRLRSLGVGATWLVAGVGLGHAVAGLPGAAAGGVAAVGAPVARARHAEARRNARMQEQLVDAASSIASGLRAGLSLVQVIGLAGDEADPPLGATLRGLADRVLLLGEPLSEALDRWVSDVAQPEARLVAGVLRLQHRTGGDLPAVLDRLARTLRDREAAAREIRSLTAQARLSGAILGLLPVGFFLFLSATSRREMAAAYQSRVGATAIVAGLLMQGAAFLWIRRLLRVES